MKLLITGCKGQLGLELQRQLQCGFSALGSIPPCFVEAVTEYIDRDELDITDARATRDFIHRSKPDIIINCAGYTNVEGCESHENEAFAVNALGPLNLAVAAQEIGTKLLHISSDYVFGDNVQTPRSEYDQPSPMSVYGRTKLLGEEYVKNFCRRWIIIRTAWMYGYGGTNFVKTILAKAKNNEKISVVDDQLGNPSNAEDVAYHILKIAATDIYGIYHCTGLGVCSWFAFASKIVELSGLPAKVLPCATTDYRSAVKRPAYSALEHRMLRATVGDEMRPWQEALVYYMEHRKEYET